MGEHFRQSDIERSDYLDFMKHLLNDVEALDILLKNGLIESGIARIGAEQEFCIITDHWRPSDKAVALLESINDSHFTTELAKYNLEINLDPLELKDSCFSEMEATLRQLLEKASNEAFKQNNKILLCGILPTISKNELELDFMTPNPRYYALNDRMKELRGGDFEVKLRGVDEFSIVHDSVLFEACNTSFQLHLQLDPDDFVSSYNWSQAISGPLLGICNNSPLLMGRELWSETRVALFQQSIDTRRSSYAIKDQQARVSFGSDWEYGTAADIFKRSLADYKVILTKNIPEDSLVTLEKGNVPKLEALNLHNGTVYRWNRPCYGVGGGKAHLRIENRYIPSGPTVQDQVANFVFWVGLMKGRPAKYNDMASIMEFKDAKANFIKAARTGKESILKWDGELISVRDLVLNVLLPIAEQGLIKCKLSERDIKHYLNIIRSRAIHQTGSQWQIMQYRSLLKSGLKRDDALVYLTRSIYENQNSGKDISNWGIDADIMESPASASNVEHVMSTQLFTVREKDLAAFATRVMAWKNIHHLPVENEMGDLAGLLTWTHMERYQQRQQHDFDCHVKEIMTKNVLTVSPSTSISEAIALMKKNEFGCLPVVLDQQLVGIITIKDVIPYDID